MNTKEYKTLSEIVPMHFPKIVGNNQFQGTTIAAIDGGYSAVKCVGPTRACIFESYAKIIPFDTQIMGDLKETDILLKDNLTNELWAVGSLAETMMDRRDTEGTTDQYLFDRYRYHTDVYKAVMTAGLGLCLLETDPKNNVVVQTGLPSSYKTRDQEELQGILSGHYDFDLKLGNSAFTHFVFDIDKDNVVIIEQPQGTLFSCLYDKNGYPIKANVPILSSNTIIYDIGFNTEDIFAIRGGVKYNHNTYTDTGMRAVFEDVIAQLNQEYGTDYKVFEFQKFLENGKASYFDRGSFAQKDIDFSQMLFEANERICRKSVERLMQTYDNLLDYKYLIVTGGTGESRFNQISDMLKGLTNLKVIAANENDPSLPFSFSNVRGYYMYQYQVQKRKVR